MEGHTGSIQPPRKRTCGHPPEPAWNGTSSGFEDTRIHQDNPYCFFVVPTPVIVFSTGHIFLIPEDQPHTDQSTLSPCDSDRACLVACCRADVLRRLLTWVGPFSAIWTRFSSAAFADPSISWLVVWNRAKTVMWPTEVQTPRMIAKCRKGPHRGEAFFCVVDCIQSRTWGKSTVAKSHQGET